jgi:hypothetical protein
MSEKRKLGTCDLADHPTGTYRVHFEPHCERDTCLNWRSGEPVASPQATEMQTRILDAAYAQQKRMERAAQPASGTRPQAERPNPEPYSFDTCSAEEITQRIKEARAVAPVETPDEKPLRQLKCWCPNDSDTCVPCWPERQGVETRLTAEQWLKENWPQNFTLRQSYFIDDLKVMLEAFRDKSESASHEKRRMELHYAETNLGEAERDNAGLREEIERLTTQRNKCADVIMEVAIILDKQGAIPPQVKALKSELAELQKAVWAMTPGGSEFANDTERCLDFIRDRMRSNVEQVKLRKAAEAEVAALREAAEEILKCAPSPQDFEIGGRYDYGEDCGNAGDVSTLGAAQMHYQLANIVRKALSAAPEVK